MIVQTAAGSVGAEQVGEGPDLLLLHSLLTDRRVYDRVLPALSATRRVTLVDLPGYGDSARQEGLIEAYAGAVIAAAEALELSPDMAVVGNGLGAFVALALAIHNSDRVGKVVLAGVAARVPDDAKGAFDVMAERALTEGMASVAPVAIARIFTADYMAEHPDMVEERRRVIVSMDPTGFAAGCRAIRDLDFSEGLGRTTTPTLVVVGSDDEATPPHYGREVATGIPGALYTELPDVAHGPQLQAPEQFVAAIGPFLGIP